MKAAVMGAGGVGGYFGGLLARAGHEVTFIARGAHLEAIKENGLRVESHLDGTFTVPGNATQDTAEAGVQDLVIFTVKMYHNSEAAASSRSGWDRSTCSTSSGEIISPPRLIKSLARPDRKM